LLTTLRNTLASFFTAMGWGLLHLVLLVRLPSQGPKRVHVRVSYVTGRSAFLDKGSKQGLRVGDQVLLRFPGNAPLKLRIRVVSESSSRVTLPSGLALPPQGAAGEVLVPQDRFQQKPKNKKGTQKPKRAHTHPPWTRLVPKAGPGESLLAPVMARRARERPTRWDGRWRVQALRTWDQAGGGTSGFGLFRTGLNLRGRNPLHNGGEFRMDAEVQRRQVYLQEEADPKDNRGRVNRLYYRKEGKVFSYQAGRFVSIQHPEIGVLDGGNLEVAVSRKGRVGLLLGSLADATDALSTGNDLGFALYWVRETEDSRLRAAFQKTWHKGVPDRDLFVVSGEKTWEGLRLYAHSLFDHYGDLDRVKAKGFDWTEGMFRLSLDVAEGQSVQVSLTHLTLPETRRFEFPALASDLLRNFRSDRLSVSTDHDLGGGFEAGTRLDFWKDQDNSGVSVEASLRADEVLFSDGDVDLLVYRRESSFFTGPGFRLRARKDIGDVDLSFSYEWAAYETVGTVAGGSTLTDQSVNLSLDYQPEAPWYGSVFLERRFGDGRDSWSLGMFWQIRF